MTPYYSDEYVTLYHGDCAEVLPTIATASIDIAVTSPPYNMGITSDGKGGYSRVSNGADASRFRDGYGGDNDDALDYPEYDALHRRILGELWRVTTSAVFYNHRPRVDSGRLRFPLDGDYGEAVLRQIITWDRWTGIDVSLSHFCTRGEWIMLFAHDAFALVDKSASGMGDVWRLGMERDVDHPAPFPLSLPTRCLMATGAATVIDPFAGSGTTLRAAKDLGRRAIGIERVERFCEMAARRLGQGVLDFGSAGS